MELVAEIVGENWENCKTLIDIDLTFGNLQ